MGSSSFCTSISIACIVLMSVMAMSPSSNALDLNSICSKTMNPSFCLSVLSSDPRVRKSLDLHGLANVTLDLAHSNATATRDNLVQWEKRTGSPISRLRYASCLSNYNDAIADFQQAKESVRLGNYGDLRDAAAGALGEMNGCGENFKQPPADPTTLQQDTLNLLDFSSIISVLSHMLLQSSY